LPEVFRTVTERIQSGIKAVSKRRSEPPERTGKSPINSPYKKQIMAQNEENLLLRGTSGTIAKMITYRQRAGKTVISKKRGKSSVPATETQLNVQDRFKKAVAWAKGAIKDPAIKAMYRAKAALGQSAFNVATVDAYNPPQVESIQTDGHHGALGDTTTVKATNRIFALSTIFQKNVTGEKRIHIPPVKTTPLRR